MSKNKFFLAFTLFAALIIGGRPSFGHTRRLTAKAIVERMAAQYAQAASYQDTGVVIDEGENQDRPVIKFKTYFARPQLFRFEWLDYFIGTGKERLSVVWNDGQQTYNYHSWSDEGVEKIKNLGLGIAGATGISRGAAHLIPALLLEEEIVGGFRLIEMARLSLRGAEKFEGEDCYLIRGYHPMNFPIDMWISKRDFLLRKIRETRDDGSAEVDIRRNVKLNQKIPAETFNYTPPKSQPSSKVAVYR